MRSLGPHQVLRLLLHLFYVVYAIDRLLVRLACGNRARQLRIDAIPTAYSVPKVPNLACHRQVLPLLLQRLLCSLLDFRSDGVLVTETATLVSTTSHQALILAASEFERRFGHIVS